MTAARAGRPRAGRPSYLRQEANVTAIIDRDSGTVRRLHSAMFLGFERHALPDEMLAAARDDEIDESPALSGQFFAEEPHVTMWEPIVA